MTSIKRNLLFGLGFSLLLLILSSVASFISIQNLIKNSRLLKESDETITSIGNLLNSVKDLETGQRGFLLTSDDRFLEPYNAAKIKLENDLEVLKANIGTTESQQRNYDLLESSIKGRVEILDRNLEFMRDHDSVTTAQLMEGKKYMDQIRKTVANMKSEEENILMNRTQSMDQFARFTPWLIVLSSLLAITITLVFYRKVSQDFEEKTKLTDSLEASNKESANRLQAIDQVAQKISDGDYDILSDTEAQEQLGNVAAPLNKMAASLQSTFNQLADSEWLNASVATLNVKMMGDKKPEVFAKEILDTITEHTKSAVAAIYLLEQDNQLHLAGSYALSNQADKTLNIGEGIAGQAFKSGKQILVEQVPEEHMISFASGKAKPNTIVAFPIKRHNIPIGVVELGATQLYTPLQLQYLADIAENIGIAVHSAQSRIKLQELLEETQAQSEELQSQHSELENINAELEAQSQRLLASEEELRVQQEELMQSNQELEERSSLLEEKNALIEQHNLDIQQKSRELEQSTKYKSEFLANMSHELRTPLNSILLLSKLMSDSKDLDKEYVEYAEVMQSSGQGLLTLIDEILDLSKIEAGKMTLDLHEVAVADIAKDMERLFKPIADQKGISLEIHTEKLTVQQIRTDKLRVEQVLKNLLSNALKFTSEGSVKLSISSTDADKRLRFSVKDTGIGIAPEKLNLVFEAFQQADGSTQRKYGGTGLGLSISRELARLLGGTIELKSKEGVGSEFTLVLPLDAEDVQEPVEAAEIKAEPTPVRSLPAKPAEPPTPTFVTDNIPNAIEDDRDAISENDKVILIIEDDTDFAKILLKYARGKNYKGIVAVRGDVGVEMAQHYKPLAILLDIQLPVMDGWQVMEALKSNPSTRPIPVHMMSSLKMRQESLLKGAVDFINKPFALEHLQDMFKKLEHALNKSPKKVLIIEENEQHAKALSYFLSAHDITTEIAYDVNKSIHSLQNREVDCVILDMGVPDKNAYNTLETIKQQQGLENLPIIVFTGKNLSKGEENRIKKYADSIVVKTAYSYQRILDEAGLFLHLVEEKNKKPSEKEDDRMGQLRNILKDKKVLIADDDVRNIFSLTKALEVHGMTVLPAMDGKEAMKVLESNPEVDIVLMDMMMPEQDGYDTIREMRASPKYKNLPILAVTAKAMMGDREKCIAVGASDFISKPVDVDQLVSLLRVWLYDRL